MKKLIAAVLIAAAALTAGCARVETGEVGVRVGFDKQVQQGELLPGSFNQTLIGNVLTFPVKDVNAEIDNITPIAKDNSTMADFDLSIIYNIEPNQVSEIYSTKARSFHAVHDGDIFLMYNWITQAGRNAAYKAARGYDALDMNDQRAQMETQIKELVTQAAANEGVKGIHIARVQIKSISPAGSVVASANELVRAKNDLLKREVEVKTAEAEARRIEALNKNSKAIEYMNAQANFMIAEGVKNGKVHTIVIPADFKGIVNAGK